MIGELLVIIFMGCYTAYTIRNVYDAFMLGRD